jgi:hypothetical protein
MKTEDLVSLLSTGTEPVDLRLATRRWLLALAGGASIAFLLTAGLLKLNPTLLQEASKPMFWIRESYCAVLGALGFVAAVRLARPGSPLGVAPMGIPVAVIATWVLGAATLVMAAPQNRAPLILGHTAAVCPFLIALLATPLWTALLWVMRSLAPTRLRWAGAASGFTAGSIGALAYTLHCPELAPPFFAIWYLLGMLIPAAIGAWLGPRLLRW